MRLSIREGDEWTKRTARIGFPILVEYARSRRVITYGEWDAEIVRRGLGTRVVAVQYGYPAGTIGDACKEYADQTGVPVPPINLMVVNQKEQLPGRGADEYIRRFCAHFLGRDVDPHRLSDRERRTLIGLAQKEIFDFPSWGDVLEACGLDETANTKAPRSKLKRRCPRRSGWNTGPESDAHKSFKQRISDEPILVELKTDEKGAQEHSLWSGDRVDVYFKRAAVAVEVKTAEAGFDELHRGIFQCVKYKAVLQAQQIYKHKIPTADCLLALGGTFPEELQEIADLFGVRYYAQLAE